MKEDNVEVRVGGIDFSFTDIETIETGVGEMSSSPVNTTIFLSNSVIIPTSLVGIWIPAGFSFTVPESGNYLLTGNIRYQIFKDPSIPSRNLGLQLGIFVDGVLKTPVSPIFLHSGVSGEWIISGYPLSQIVSIPVPLNTPEIPHTIELKFSVYSSMGIGPQDTLVVASDQNGKCFASVTSFGSDFGYLNWNA